MKKVQNIPVDRGALLKKVAKASGMTIELIVARMNYSSRNTFYDHTKNSELPLDILRRYGKVFKYDFSADIPELNEFKVEDDEPFYLKAPVNLEEATSQRDFYHKRYMDLLEQVRELEKENAELKSGKGDVRKK